jgi:hypothetical protein
MEDMALHIVGFTKQEFFDSIGGNCGQIMDALQAEFFRTMQAAARDPQSYTAKTVMEVHTIADFEPGGFPEGYDDYIELFYLNNPALAICQQAGVVPLRLIATCEQADLPQNTGLLVRLPLYLHRDQVPDRTTTVHTPNA